MPRIRLTKSAIDALSTPASDVVYWDAALPGFGVKVTPRGRKVFIVLYRTGGAGSKLRKYTLGLYGRLTLHQARIAAQKVFAAKLEGRDPAAEKREAKRQVVTDGGDRAWRRTASPSLDDRSRAAVHAQGRGSAHVFKRGASRHVEEQSPSTCVPSMLCRRRLIPLPPVRYPECSTNVQI